MVLNNYQTLINQRHFGQGVYLGLHAKGMFSAMLMKKIIILILITTSLLMTNTLMASNVKEFEIDGVKLGMSKEMAFAVLDSTYGKAKGYARIDKVTFFGYENGSEVVTVFMGAFMGEYKAKSVIAIVKKVSGDDYNKAKIIKQINSKYGKPNESIEFDDDYSSRWCRADHAVNRCAKVPYHMLLEASSNQAQLTIKDLSEYYE